MTTISSYGNNTMEGIIDTFLECATSRATKSQLHEDSHPAIAHQGPAVITAPADDALCKDSGSAL